MANCRIPEDVVVEFGTLKLADTRTIKRLNKLAIRNRYNRAVADHALRHLDAHGVHVLQFVLRHEHAAGAWVKPHARCILLMKIRRRRSLIPVFLDVDFHEFMRLDDPDYRAQVPDGLQRLLDAA